MIRLEVSPFTPLGLFPANPMSPAPSHAIGLAQHAFEVTGQGLMHYTDGQLRATVPPESWDDYAEHYAMAREVIEAHRAQVAAAAAAAAAAAPASNGGQS